MSAPVIAVVIPARNEALALPHVLGAIPARVDHVIVADNGSTDGSADVARTHGARTVNVPQAGYGRACLAAIADAETLGADIIVFLDGDHSDYPEQMPQLYTPIVAGEADMVIGSRTRGRRTARALTPQQIFGNALACWLIARIWGYRYTDLGPFRAIRTSALRQLAMAEQTYGWTVEMQIRAVQHRLRIIEVPVDYRARIGKSKVSGTVRGVVLAGYYILAMIARAALSPPPAPR
ncbi:MAG: glycosyltransferase family 2 protein [Sphingomonas sp.]|uniref:glycosyltransferase family 2 protein n=1 Tax=Sphingomonas sp. TaxID=28214 RepID=UPI000DB1AEA7|nr:UDP-glucose--dolichyl-phosphate glucosyltransferase [Zymomonas sp.]MBA4772345.1 glycosyltransferase family 2 protein [Sphingomonas sp.]PZP12549.1 MAG: UDP-glucose--dolichyl-phosphate glucosyltransferase [Sphingomonas hengshuiensis]